MTKMCLTCGVDKRYAEYPIYTINGKKKRRDECILCYNRHNDISCDTCPIKIQADCRERAKARVPVICEEWYDDEYARIGITLYEYEEKSREEIIRRAVESRLYGYKE